MHALALILASLGVAEAGGIAWLDRDDPAPGSIGGEPVVPAAEVVSGAAWTDTDQSLIAAVEAEIARVKPMLDVFDGELEIIRSLDASLASVPSLHSEGDRDIVWRALVLQGFAAHRYFLEDLATAPEAARVRTGDGRNAAWVEALALDAARMPSDLELPDADARRAFQELRAAVLLAPPVTIDAPNDSTLRVDGRSWPGGQARVPPGPHHIELDKAGQLVLRQRGEYAAGETVTLPQVVAQEELFLLGDLLASAGAARVSPDVEAALDAAGIDAVAVVRKGAPRVFVVTDTVAVERKAEPTSGGGGPGWALSAGLGPAVLSDGTWYSLAAESGLAPERSIASTTGLGPVLTLGALRSFGVLHAGALVDVVLPVGEAYVVRTGSLDLRPRVHAGLAAGVAPAQLTVGFLFPFHPTVGIRGVLPLGALQLEGRGYVGPQLALDGGGFSAEHPFVAGPVAGGQLTVAFAL